MTTNKDEASKDHMPTFITQFATAEELREASKGPDRCPRHHGTAANPDALPCEEGALYAVGRPSSPDVETFECSHQAANSADLFGDADLFGEENRMVVTKVEAP